MGERTDGTENPAAAGERTPGRTHGTYGGRLRSRTVALLPLILILGAVSRYTETRTGVDPVTRSATTTITAFVLAAMIHAGRRFTRRNADPAVAVLPRGAALRVLAVGTFGVAAPLTLLAWSRYTLSPNAVGVMLAVTTLLLAFRSRRREAAIAALMLTGSALLVIGRLLGLGFPPVRAAYLSIVSGAVLNFENAATAIAAVLVAGALATILYRKVVEEDIAARPGTLSLLLLPAAVGTSTIALTTGSAVRGEPVWHMVSGAVALATLAAIVTLVRRSTPLTAATGALAAFLPMVLVSARLQGAPLTTPMRIGAALVIVAAIANRITLRKTTRSQAEKRGDR